MPQGYASSDPEVVMGHHSPHRITAPNCSWQRKVVMDNGTDNGQGYT